ncbi:unnamed protein product [Prorocentrum cordatum]|uniref:Phytanoyl-CoA dioxygenase family protein n=1 Tax=Prorocentrum cordatum TaxID=2364126 RepID=A0ABN9WAM4_9DINO|nr:unnamed protein product [Polarella glacialis]
MDHDRGGRPGPRSAGVPHFGIYRARWIWFRIRAGGESKEMEPGDVLFTHSNLLHMSAPNHSEHWRRVMIVAYNGRDNSPFEDATKNMICPVYEQIRVVDDGAVKRVGAKGLLGQSKGTTLSGRQAGFLDHGQNVRQFARGAR